ncbi:MAG: adenylosuccinate synthase [Candidatus Omnitrophica bacterium]|nr:adenylosuccinate synthase [Candidatus Omnitrophota bacterium]
MSNIVVVGTQWGDEGKGKIIDYLAKDSDVIVRYQGGNNAGHTVVINNKEFILHLIPSGILHKGKLCIVGNGVVVDPSALLLEIKELKNRGVDIDSNLLISEQAHVIFPYHKLLDQLREKKRKIGTTGRGIGPCYADKVGRVGIRVVDLLDKEIFAQKLKLNLEEKNEIIKKVYGDKGFSFQKIYKEYRGYAKEIKKYVKNTTLILKKAIDRKKSILFEGAQGTLLDIDFGTYPYVTASNASVGGVCTGTGVSPKNIDKIIGVAKAYTTRVGEGPFPTEFKSDLMEKIRLRGKEFGATTGRPRRCGWFDTVLVRYSIMVNGIDELAITKLDVLDEMENIKICVGYKYKGKIYHHFPSDLKILFEGNPVYEEQKGWLSDTSQITSFDNLPPNAKLYLKRLSKLLEIKVKLISVGSERNQTFVL